MAQVDDVVHREIEALLDRVSDEWGRLPDVEAEIDQWDWVDAVVFIEEWTLEEEALLRLERRAMQGVLTPEQLTRYNDLQVLIAKNRPIIQRLRES